VDGPRRCRGCGREFQSANALRQHAERIHAEPVRGVGVLSDISLEGGLALPVIAAAIGATTRLRRRR
jgi:hypothetical protein